MMGLVSNMFHVSKQMKCMLSLLLTNDQQRASGDLGSLNNSFRCLDLISRCTFSCPRCCHGNWMLLYFSVTEYNIATNSTIRYGQYCALLSQSDEIILNVSDNKQTCFCWLLFVHVAFTANTQTWWRPYHRVGRTRHPVSSTVEMVSRVA